MCALRAENDELTLHLRVAQVQGNVETAHGEGLDTMLGGIGIPRQEFPHLETDVDYRERAKGLAAEVERLRKFAAMIGDYGYPGTVGDRAGLVEVVDEWVDAARALTGAAPQSS